MISKILDDRIGNFIEDRSKMDPFDDCLSPRYCYGIASSK